MYNELIERKEQELLAELKTQLRQAGHSLEEERQLVRELQDQLAEMDRAHHNNLNVIEEIQQENDDIKQAAIKLRKDCDAKDRTIQQLSEKLEKAEAGSEQRRGSLQAQITQTRLENERLANELQRRDTKSDEGTRALERIELKHKIELEQVSQFAAQKLKSEQSYHSKAMQTLRSETERTVRELKQSNELLLSENRRLMESLNALKESSLETESRLADKLEKLERQSKQSDYCRGLYEQELENVKQSSSSWEQSLQAKIQELQDDKHKVLEELAEYKQQRKHKTSQLKRQFAEKVEELTAEKAKAMRRYEEVAKDLKLDNEKLHYTNQQLRKQVQDFEKIRRQLEEETESRIHLFTKNAEQDKRAARNDLELKSGRLEEVTRELDESRKTIAELKVVVEKLRFTAETRTSEYETLKLEFNRYKAIARANQQKQPPREQQPAQSNNAQEYSKYFSEDMGPIDEAWFERKSGVRNQHSAAKQPALRDAYELKKAEALDRENAELKDAVARLAREMQEVRDSMSQKMDLKQREIKLCKDETYMLRDRLNEKEQEIYRHRDKLSQAEMEIVKLQERCRHLKESEDQEKASKEAMEGVEQELRKIRAQLTQIQHDNQALIEERERLVAISSELRAQLNHYESLMQLQPSDMLGLSSKQMHNHKMSSQEAEVSEINRLLDPGRMPSEVYSTDRQTRKQPMRQSPTQLQPSLAQQPTHATVSSAKRPESLLNLVRQRKNLQREARQPLHFELQAGQARLHESEKDRMNLQTQSQRDAFERLRKRSKQKTPGEAMSNS